MSILTIIQLESKGYGPAYGPKELLVLVQILAFPVCGAVPEVAKVTTPGCRNIAYATKEAAFGKNSLVVLV